MQSHKKELTAKEFAFIKAYTQNSGNGTKAALMAFNTTDEGIAASMASEYLRKPKVKEALRGLGFSSDAAKLVVSDIMHNKKANPLARLKATDQVFKVEGSYAPEKHLHATFSLIELGKSAQELLEASKEGLQLEAPEEDTQ